MRLELRSTNHPVRLVVSRETPSREVERARRERANFKMRLRRLRRTPEQRARDAAYYRAYHARNSARREEQKRRWREENRDEYNAYFRRYDQLTPGRKEYKARKAREYRARDRAARSSA